MTLKLIVIIMVIVRYLYSITLDVVKYRSSNNTIPETVADIYDQETYLKWRKYSAEHCRLNMVSSIISCIITLVLLITNAYAHFSYLFPADNIHLQLISRIIVETIVDLVIGTVIGYVRTMVIEQKYGFNR